MEINKICKKKIFLKKYTTKVKFSETVPKFWSDGANLSTNLSKFIDELSCKPEKFEYEIYSSNNSNEIWKK